MTELSRHTVGAHRGRRRTRRLAVALALGAVVAGTVASPALAAGWSEPAIIVPSPVTQGQPATFSVLCEDPDAAGVMWWSSYVGGPQVQPGGVVEPGGKRFSVTTTYPVGTSWAWFQAGCTDFSGTNVGPTRVSEFAVVAPRPTVALTAPTSAYASVPFELSARVTAPEGGVAPTGLVEFLYSEGAFLGSASVVDGVARTDVVVPSSGLLDSVVAVYRGDSTYGGTSSTRANITVAPTPVPVVAVSAPATAGTSGLTATVTVAAPDSSLPVPGGDIQLIIHDPAVIGPVSVTNGTLVGGTVTVTTGTLPVGTYQLLAHYSGGGGAPYAQTDSPEQTLTVSAPPVTPGPTTPTTPPVTTPTTPPTTGPAVPAPTTPAPAAEPVPQVSTSSDRTRPGSEVTLVARGFVPGERVTFVLHSDPVVLGTAVADAAGVASLTVTLPTDVPAGAHRVVATGVDSGREAEVPVTLVAAAPARSRDELATTGADPAALTGLVAALLVSGSALALGARYRRSRG